MKTCRLIILALAIFVLGCENGNPVSGPEAGVVLKKSQKRCASCGLYLYSDVVTLRVLDPSTGTEVGSVGIPGLYNSEMVRNGDYVYIFPFLQEGYVIDLTDPAHPGFDWDKPFLWADVNITNYAPQIVGSFLMVSTVSDSHERGVSVFDITDAAHPVSVGGFYHHRDDQPTKSFRQ